MEVKVFLCPGRCVLAVHPHMCVCQGGLLCACVRGWDPWPLRGLVCLWLWFGLAHLSLQQGALQGDRALLVPREMKLLTWFL